MATRRFQPRLWTTVCTLPVLALLIALGGWQLDRLAWKLDLIAQRQAALAAPPRMLGSEIPKSALDFAKVRVRGRFLHDLEIHLIAPPRLGRRGYHVLTPLRLDRGDALVLIDRGWVPDARKAAASRREGLIAGPIELSGIARTPRQAGWFTPANEPQPNIWYWPDIAAIEDHLGVDLRPIVVEADAAPNPGGYPIGGQTSLQIANNHLGYAITWFGLAAGLVAVYIGFHWRRREATG